RPRECLTHSFRPNVGSDSHVGGSELVLAEQRGGRAFLDDPPVGGHQAEAAHGVQTQLPAEDFAGLVLVPAADNRPVQPGQTCFLNLKLVSHWASPLRGCWLGPTLGPMFVATIVGFTRRGRAASPENKPSNRRPASRVRPPGDNPGWREEVPGAPAS